MKISMEVEWEIFDLEDHEGYIGVCDSLGIAVEAASEAEVEEDLRDAIALLLEDLEETGELERVAVEQGWDIQRSAPPSSLPVGLPLFRMALEGEMVGPSAHVARETLAPKSSQTMHLNVPVVREPEPVGESVG